MDVKINISDDERSERIYTRAVLGLPKSYMNPPLTMEEETEWDEIVLWAKNEREKAKKEGRTIMFVNDNEKDF